MARLYSILLLFLLAGCGEHDAHERVQIIDPDHPIIWELVDDQAPITFDEYADVHDVFSAAWGVFPSEVSAAPTLHLHMVRYPEQLVLWGRSFIPYNQIPACAPSGCGGITQRSGFGGELHVFVASYKDPPRTRRRLMAHEMIHYVLDLRHGDEFNAAESILLEELQ